MVVQQLRRLLVVERTVTYNSGAVGNSFVLEQKSPGRPHPGIGRWPQKSVYRVYGAHKEVTVRHILGESDH